MRASRAGQGRVRRGDRGTGPQAGRPQWSEMWRDPKARRRIRGAAGSDNLTKKQTKAPPRLPRPLPCLRHTTTTRTKTKENEPNNLCLHDFFLFLFLLPLLGPSLSCFFLNNKTIRSDGAPRGMSENTDNEHKARDTDETHKTQIAGLALVHNNKARV